ncbi:hypothetical protein [Streptomyces sp. NPDC015131]|uniref:hypothetical protein n=1 Tax=Streptomyces sp. NPDC015131 TaxID=3364941 RepID=UPI0036FE2BB6
MQRTRITAKVLVTVAVAAVSGCVAVDSDAPTVPAGTTASLPDRPGAAPQIVPGPAREALEAALPPEPSSPGPRPPRGPDAADAPDRAAPAAVPPAAPPRGAGDDRPARLPSAERLRDRLPGAVREHVPAAAPELPPSVPDNVPDVCEFGRDQGGWDPDSRRARLCREALGH